MKLIAVIGKGKYLADYFGALNVVDISDIKESSFVNERGLYKVRCDSFKELSAFILKCHVKEVIIFYLSPHELIQSAIKNGQGAESLLSNTVRGLKELVNLVKTLNIDISVLDIGTVPKIENCFTNEVNKVFKDAQSYEFKHKITHEWLLADYLLRVEPELIRLLSTLDKLLKFLSYPITEKRLAVNIILSNQLAQAKEQESLVSLNQEVDRLRNKLEFSEFRLNQKSNYHKEQLEGMEALNASLIDKLNSLDRAEKDQQDYDFLIESFFRIQKELIALKLKYKNTAASLEEEEARENKVLMKEYFSVQQELLKTSEACSTAQIEKSKLEEKYRLSLATYNELIHIKNSYIYKAMVKVNGLFCFLLPSFRKKQEEDKNKSLIKDSNLFDEQWYLHNYSDVQESGMDPILHYLRHGAQEGRDPCSQFSTLNYLNINKDVSNDTINPLIHYILFGKDEGRCIK